MEYVFVQSSDDVIKLHDVPLLTCLYAIITMGINLVKMNICVVFFGIVIASTLKELNVIFSQSKALTAHSFYLFGW